MLKKAACDSKDCLKGGGRAGEGDVRPPEEYDEPWDQKLKNRSMLSHAGESIIGRQVCEHVTLIVNVLILVVLAVSSTQQHSFN